jgi:peroxiredoxin
MNLKQHVPFLLTLSLGMAILLPAGACGDNKPQEAAKAPEEVKVFVDTSTLKPAADFELPDITGVNHTLAGYKGKVVILNFWATWCGPCKYEIPHFIKLYNAYKDKGVTILGVAIGEPKATVETFAKSKGMTYPVLLDVKSAVPRSYGGVRGIPTTFVITQDGKIYRKHVGVPADMAIFEEEVKALLGVQAQSQSQPQSQ